MGKQKLSPVAFEIKMLCALFMRSVKKDIGRQLKTYRLHINPLGFGVLNIVRHNEWTLSELSKETMLTPATLVPVIQTLEKKGFIERRLDSRDRRRSPLYLTRQGEKMLAKIFSIDERDIVVRKLKELGGHDAGELRRILRKLIGLFIGEKKLKEILESHTLKNPTH